MAVLVANLNIVGATPFDDRPGPVCGATTIISKYRAVNLSVYAISGDRQSVQTYVSSPDRAPVSAPQLQACFPGKPSERLRKVTGKVRGTSELNEMAFGKRRHWHWYQIRRIYSNVCTVQQ